MASHDGYIDKNRVYLDIWGGYVMLVCYYIEMWSWSVLSESKGKQTEKSYYVNNITRFQLWLLFTLEKELYIKCIQLK